MEQIKNLSAKLFFALFITVLLSGCTPSDTTLFEITYDAELGKEAYDGRLLVLITKDDSKEPRFQINDSDETGIIVGKNVEYQLTRHVSLSTSGYGIDASSPLQYPFSVIYISG